MSRVVIESEPSSSSSAPYSTRGQHHQNAIESSFHKIAEAVDLLNEGKFSDNTGRVSSFSVLAQHDLSDDEENSSDSDVSSVSSTHEAYDKSGFDYRKSKGLVEGLLNTLKITDRNSTMNELNEWFLQQFRATGKDMEDLDKLETEHAIAEREVDDLNSHVQHDIDEREISAFRVLNKFYGDLNSAAEKQRQLMAAKRLAVEKDFSHDQELETANKEMAAQLEASVIELRRQLNKRETDLLNEINNGSTSDTKRFSQEPKATDLLQIISVQQDEIATLTAKLEGNEKRVEVMKQALKRAARGGKKIQKPAKTEDGEDVTDEEDNPVEEVLRDAQRRVREKKMAEFMTARKDASGQDIDEEQEIVTLRDEIEEMISHLEELQAEWANLKKPGDREKELEQNIKRVKGEIDRLVASIASLETVAKDVEGGTSESSGAKLAEEISKLEASNKELEAAIVNQEDTLRQTQATLQLMEAEKKTYLFHREETMRNKNRLIGTGMDPQEAESMAQKTREYQTSISHEQLSELQQLSMQEEQLTLELNMLEKQWEDISRQNADDPSNVARASKDHKPSVDRNVVLNGTEEDNAILQLEAENEQLFSQIEILTKQLLGTELDAEETQALQQTPNESIVDPASNSLTIPKESTPDAKKLAAIKKDDPNSGKRSSIQVETAALQHRIQLIESRLEGIQLENEELDKHLEQLKHDKDKMETLFKNMDAIKKGRKVVTATGTLAEPSKSSNVKPPASGKAHESIQSASLREPPTADKDGKGPRISTTDDSSIQETRAKLAALTSGSMNALPPSPTSASASTSFFGNNTLSADGGVAVSLDTTKSVDRLSVSKLPETHNSSGNKNLSSSPSNESSRQQKQGQEKQQSAVAAEPKGKGKKGRSSSKSPSASPSATHKKRDKQNTSPKTSPKSTANATARSTAMTSTMSQSDDDLDLDESSLTQVDADMRQDIVELMKLKKDNIRLLDQVTLMELKLKSMSSKKPTPAVSKVGKTGSSTANAGATDTNDASGKPEVVSKAHELESHQNDLKKMIKTKERELNAWRQKWWMERRTAEQTRHVQPQVQQGVDSTAQAAQESHQVNAAITNDNRALPQQLAPGVVGKSNNDALSAKELAEQIRQLHFNYYKPQQQPQQQQQQSRRDSTDNKDHGPIVIASSKQVYQLDEGSHSGGGGTASVAPGSPPSTAKLSLTGNQARPNPPPTQLHSGSKTAFALAMEQARNKTADSGSMPTSPFTTISYGHSAAQPSSTITRNVSRGSLANIMGHYQGASTVAASGLGVQGFHTSSNSRQNSPKMETHHRNKSPPLGGVTPAMQFAQLRNSLSRGGARHTTASPEQLSQLAMTSVKSVNNKAYLYRSGSQVYSNK
eukprot:GILJ01007805.1.p1 GENE.GILJ01007805.1~~GILJ01007805.1.p1  ORF type:complete len:1370 (+),score=310.39 GILJ01007805.1:48-4157(+)